jgi:nicotinamide phosphoribosyltransferase
MMEVVPRLLALQEMAFGSVTNAKGYKKINTVGIIQGDGVDHMSIKSLLGKVLALGYSADNVIFGSGGALLQKVNRDTFKFAQKASAIRVEEGGRRQWKGIAKNPVTDPGKVSKQGRLTLVRNHLTGEYLTVPIGADGSPLDEEFQDVMLVVYDCGRLLNATTLDEVRARAARGL